MEKRSPWLRRLALLAMLLIPSALAWSDAGLASHPAESKKTCYCGCDMKAGTPMCMHMCELPKYENRSWASSCNRKKSAPVPEAPAQSGTQSRKNNRVQDARL
jgi:hypothetical protein